jgi:hypothetical protein
MRRTGPAPLTKNFSAPTPLILQLFSPIGDFNCSKSYRDDEKNGAAAFFVKHCSSDFYEGALFPRRSRPHENPRVTIPRFQQLFSPIGNFNC